MNKAFITAFAIAAALAASPVIAADEKYDGASGNMKTEGSMNPTPGQGAPSNQAPGNATSDRTPGKTTTTPEAQIDRSKSGETSDRTPKNH